MITGSKELIRDINSHLVLEAVVNDGPISRVELSKKLGLTKATISAIVQDLIDTHFILEVGSLDTVKGRKPILLRFHQQGGFVLSIDLSIHSITVLISDLKGEHCSLKQYPNTGSEDSMITSLIKIIDDITRSLPETKHGVVGISIGIHGVVHNNHIHFSPYYNLEGTRLVEELEKEFSIPVYIENEANLSVQGERSFYFPDPNLINISIHSGIGIGIILDNQLYSGFTGYAGEFGHTIVEPDGLPCPCGNHGCIEQYASERALLLKLAQRKGVSRLTMDDLVNLYLKEDEDALLIIDQFIRYISIGINNILNIFNPNMIIINSSFTMYFPDITDRIKGSLKNRMRKSCNIVPSKLQDSAILLGGVCVCIKNFLGIDYLKLNPDKTHI